MTGSVSTFDDLVAATEALLQLPATKKAIQLNSATREHAFEAFVFSLVLKAVKAAGGQVQLVGINSGPNPNPIVFRGGPGQMSSRAKDFVYGLCTLNGSTFEVHVDVQYAGASTATHEIDVSIFDAEEANRVRQARRLPGIRKLNGAIECKFYDSSLGTGLGRAFVGLVSDCGSLRVNSFVTNGRHQGLAKYLTRKSRPQPFFELSPLNPNVVARFVRDVEQSIRKWLGVN